MRRHLMFVLLAGLMLPQMIEAAEPIRVGVFDVDASPPVGTPLAYDPTEGIETSLRCRGIVLAGAGKPVVLCAVDWIGISNSGNTLFRESLAGAAGTEPARVAVHTLHQHDAPRCDFAAEEMLSQYGLEGVGFDPAFARDVVDRAAAAVKTALAGAKPVTHLGFGAGVVEKVASNRRILGPDGKVMHTRWTATRDPKIRAFPAGTIDPQLKLIGFFSGDEPIAALTYYATHPQSYYRTGLANPDFPGLARNARQEETGVPHVHFTGAAGDIGAGKWNDGSEENRQVLADRVAAGMKLAWDNMEKSPISAEDVRWNIVPVVLPPSEHMDEASLTKQLEDKSADPKDRWYAAKNLAWLRRCQGGDTIDISCLTLNRARVLHMPGELLIGYQLAAQRRRPDLFVAMAAYGDYAPGYIPMEIAYSQGGYEASPGASKVAPAVEGVLMGAVGKLLGGAPSAAAERPNVVFIYTDDQAPTAVGVAGNKEIKTPNLDRLFQDGARLVNSFTTTPVCSPTRASLMTSRYASELGIFDWIHPRTEPEHGLDPETVTFPELLAKAGYTNALVGKWHLGTADRYHPTKMGFHVFRGFREGGTKVKNPPLEIDGQVREHEGLTTDVLTDYAIEFVRENRKGPFLLCLHYRAPHAPWLPVADEDWAPYDRLDPTIPNPDFPKLNVPLIKKRTREYYASTSGVDRNVGRLLGELDALRLADNTVVIFTSDHGYNLGHNGVWYKGNAQWQLTELPPQKWPHIPPKQRPNLYDQSLRVPTAVRWPAAIKPGTVVTQTITNLDWFPTLLSMAGVELPEGVMIRGRSFLPILRGADVAWDNDMFCEYSMKHGAQTHMRGVRTPKWKLMIDFLNEGRAELYDLENDPAETTNLIDSEDGDARKVKAELRERILDVMREIGDPALGE